MPTPRKTASKRAHKPSRPTRRTPKTASQALAKLPFRLHFTQGISPRDIDANSLADAEAQGRKLSGSFMRAERI